MQINIYQLGASFGIGTTATLMSLGMILVKPLSVNAVVIDFETLSNLEVVDDQFINLGVDFNGLAGVLTSPADSLNSNAFPPISGSQVIFDDPNLSSGILRMDAVDYSWSMVGGYVTGATSITLTAYGADGKVIDTIATEDRNFFGSSTGLQPNIFLSITSPDISYVTFSGIGNSFTVDDFTFARQSIPEFTSVFSLLLFGTLATSLGFKN